MALLQPKLTLRVSQRQVLTPGLMQMVSVLALNKLELKEMIDAEMVENPVLEEIDESVPMLDEPFSGIDPIAVLELQKIIFDLKAGGIGVLITDHNVRETLSVTDRAYIIAEGKIFRAGTPQELGNDVEVRRVYLGEGFSLG